MECCICATDALAVIKYTDKLGKQVHEPRCESCVLAVVKNSKNTVHNKDEITEISTDIDKDDLKQAAKNSLANSSNSSGDDSDDSNSSDDSNTPQPPPAQVLTGSQPVSRAIQRRRNRPPYRRQDN